MREYFISKIEASELFNLSVLFWSIKKAGPKAEGGVNIGVSEEGCCADQLWFINSSFSSDYHSGFSIRVGVRGSNYPTQTLWSGNRLGYFDIKKPHGAIRVCSLNRLRSLRLHWLPDMARSLRTDFLSARGCATD
jgi:hypothetical protein